MSYLKTILIDCLLLVEAEGGVFDSYEAKLEVGEDIAFSRHIATILENSKSRSVTFLTAKGMLPVKGQFACIPFDSGRQVVSSLSYEDRTYPKSMDIEILYENPIRRNLHIRGKYRDNIIRKRLAQAIENDSVIPIFEVTKASFPMRGSVFKWGDEMKDKILIVRLWSNKLVQTREVD